MKHHAVTAAAAIIAALGVTVAFAAPATAAEDMSVTPKSAPITRQESPLAAYPLRCMVTGSNVNYRRGPGVQYASFGQVNRGFQFYSGGEVVNPKGRLEYWNTMLRPGRADSYIDSVYSYCWLA